MRIHFAGMERFIRFTSYCARRLFWNFFQRDSVTGDNNNFAGAFQLLYPCRVETSRLDKRTSTAALPPTADENQTKTDIGLGVIDPLFSNYRGWVQPARQAGAISNALRGRRLHANSAVNSQHRYFRRCFRPKLKSKSQPCGADRSVTCLTSFQGMATGLRPVPRKRCRSLWVPIRPIGSEFNPLTQPTVALPSSRYRLHALPYH